METAREFIFLSFKITTDGGCSHEIKRRFVFRRKAKTNLDSMKSRDIALPTKVCLVKTMVFPVVMLDVRVGKYLYVVGQYLYIFILSTKELMLLNCGVGENF